jgi:hypothetical protein
MRTYRSELREFYLDKLFLMRKVRFIAALCIAIWGLILWFFGIPGFNPKMFFLFAFCAMVINQPYQFIIKRLNNLDLILQMHQVIDVILVTMCIYFMG